jgi:ribosomal protein S18 acetylase RimI-like enzyme
LKFVFGFGEILESKLANVPWTNAFLPSKILVIGVDDNGDVMAVCGVRSVFNILTLYVCREWRGRGIGSQILKKTIDMAWKRRLSFILLGVFHSNVGAFRLYSKFGFKEVVFLKKSSLRIMMLSMNVIGEVTYLVLCAITSFLPNVLWAYVAQRVHDRTISDYDGC